MMATRVAAAVAVVAVTFAVLVLSPRLLLAAGPSSAPATQGASVGLPSDVQAELRSLSPGTVIVPCNSSVSRLPEGVRPVTTLGFAFAHPGFRYLSHGYCADNPNATPIPLVVPVVDGPPGRTVTVVP